VAGRGLNERLRRRKHQPLDDTSQPMSLVQRKKKLSKRKVFKQLAATPTVGNKNNNMAVVTG
jgi:hypothetical protein